MVIGWHRTGFRLYWRWLSRRRRGLPGGTFRMGSANFYKEERPVHEVTVDGFWMDAYEVTNEQFARFVAETSYVTLAERAPKPEDFPSAPPENLVPGSMVFQKRTGPVDLRQYTNWWAWMPGADWRHPKGPESSLEKDGSKRGVRSNYRFSGRAPGIFALLGEPLFRASQPRELCVQQGHGLGCGLQRRGGSRDGLGHRQEGDPGAAGALVTPEGSAAPRTLAAQLQRGLVEEDIRVVWHGCPSGHHIRSVGSHKQV
jgi:hypothetical protein